MKKMFLFILFAFSAILVGQVREELNYYHLHVGDVWQYRIIHHSVSSQVNTFYMSKKVLIDTTFGNGTKYFIVEQPKFVHWKFSTPEKIYTRIDSMSGIIYERSPLSSSEVKVDSLFCNNGVLKGNGYRELYFVHSDEKSVFGEIRKTRRLTSPTVSQGLDLTISYAMNIGVYLKGISNKWVGSEGNSYTLVYAKINGKEYGTFVSVKDEETIPTKFSLSQNYPNPFNPSTVISFKVQAASHVTLKVYDVLGREVATLVDEYKQPGTYNSQFSIPRLAGRESPALPKTQDEAGSGVNSQFSSGVYFYRLQVGKYSDTKKMVLLR
ncbi:MAG: 5'-nucleotidase [Ignavibacteria bacterium]|nr:MAG: 5'-nucleotidase [Ignavibacteria bacterium]KAF0160554.1 MAG: 5'-nucleotidase [Ignavibacteria bacterium]